MTFRIIERNEVGYRHGSGWGFRPLPATEVYAHYPGAKNPPSELATLEEDLEYARYLDDIGDSRFGAGDYKDGVDMWPGEAGAGISYSLIITKAGRIIRGHDPRRQSSHTKGHNYTGMGYCFLIANGDDLTTKQIEAAAWALREQVRLGEIVEPFINGGHRDVYATICPTDKIMARIAQINALAAKEAAPVSLLAFPASISIPTDSFWTRLEAVFRQMGYDVYCGPSFVKAGYCAPGKHPHGATSRHFKARALDIGFDPASGAAESNYEKAFLDVTVKMLRARYPLLGVVWNRGVGDHRDHAHLDDGSYGMEGVYSGVSLPAGILGFGSTGEAVRALQEALGAKPDGIFGLATYDTLRDFQFSRGLMPDGFAGPATFAALKPVVTPTPQPAPAPVPTLAERVKPYRLAGPDAYATAVVLRGFVPPAGKGVLLAARETPDHVQAGVLAGRNSNVEVLPTRQGGALPGAIANEIARIRPAWIRVAGSDSAVPSVAVEAAFKAAGLPL